MEMEIRNSINNTIPVSYFLFSKYTRRIVFNTNYNQKDSETDELLFAWKGLVIWVCPDDVEFVIGQIEISDVPIEHNIPSDTSWFWGLVVIVQVDCFNYPIRSMTEIHSRIIQNALKSFDDFYGHKG